MAIERRTSPRQIINEDAEILIAALDMRLPCVVVNLSAGGAKVTCDAFPPADSPVILFFKGGLSIEGVAVRFAEGEIGVRFTHGDEK